tara:strand:- start:495 stop:851 length:357 start_codon:yes stop_codon:yes gene_type:complete
MSEEKDNYYLHYTGSNAFAEAQAACDLCHQLASRPASEGGIEGYNAECWAIPKKHPGKEEYIVPIDVTSLELVDVPTDIQSRLDARAKLTISEVENSDWFPADLSDPANEIIAPGVDP